MSRSLHIPLLFLGLLLLGVSVYVQYLGSDYGDKQWELLYAQMWLDGRHLYTDLFAVSPPLIFWVYGLPAALARVTNIETSSHFLIITGLCLIACSVWLSVQLIRLHPGFGSAQMRIEFAALLCFVLIFRTSPIYFLDREHLFLVLIFPYLIRFMPSLYRQPVALKLSIATGILAGIGFCIKPYCLVVWAGVQIFFMLSEKSLRMLRSIENIIIYGIGLIYVASVWLLYPEYFFVVVPMALITYSAARDPASVLDYWQMRFPCFL